MSSSCVEGAGVRRPVDEFPDASGRLPSEPARTPTHAVRADRPPDEVLAVFGGLFALVLIRGGLSLAAGRRGEAWPFALLLGLMTAYELIWLRYVKLAITLGQSVSRARWSFQHIHRIALSDGRVVPGNSNRDVRSHADPDLPDRAREPDLYDLVHPSPRSRSVPPRGAFSAAGYAIVSIYIFAAYPEAAAGAPLVAYGTAISCTACLLVGGFAAGAVASQIRRHVVAALHDAEHRAKIAQFEHDLGMAQSIQQNLLPDGAADYRGL